MTERNQDLLDILGGNVRHYNFLHDYYPKVGLETRVKRMAKPERLLMPRPFAPHDAIEIPYEKFGWRDERTGIKYRIWVAYHEPSDQMWIIGPEPIEAPFA